MRYAMLSLFLQLPSRAQWLEKSNIGYLSQEREVPVTSDTLRTLGKLKLLLASLVLIRHIEYKLLLICFDLQWSVFPYIATLLITV